ncbi:MAG: hypothetical protein IJW82_01120 [Clostridia bacterium]|nr:hypothetical protein [Clostridia bacterium]
MRIKIKKDIVILGIGIIPGETILDCEKKFKKGYYIKIKGKEIALPKKYLEEIKGEN